MHSFVPSVCGIPPHTKASCSKMSGYFLATRQIVVLRLVVSITKRYRLSYTTDTQIAEWTQFCANLTHKSKLKIGLPEKRTKLKLRALRGHYEGTKSWLGHYRGQQVSTDENGKSTEIALYSVFLSRIEKANLCTGSVEVMGSNPLCSTSTKST